MVARIVCNFERGGNAYCHIYERVNLNEFTNSTEWRIIEKWDGSRLLIICKLWHVHLSTAALPQGLAVTLRYVLFYLWLDLSEYWSPKFVTLLALLTSFVALRPRFLRCICLYRDVISKKKPVLPSLDTISYSFAVCCNLIGMLHG